MHVLFSARDPGACGQLVPVIRAFHSDGRFRVSVVASGRALGHLREAGVPAEPFGGFLGLGRDERGPLLAEARKLLAQLQPDAVFTGVSSMGFGVDEALLAEARVPTFAFQDLWGETNTGLGRPAETYFVLDDYAARTTRESVGARTVVAGSPKHAAYSALDVPSMRSEARSLVPDLNGPLLGFFGQCADLPGHEENFQHFLGALRVLDGEFRLLLREHPKTSAEVVRAHLEEAARLGFQPFDATGKLGAEHWLSACDLVVTPFSTCALDHAYLSAYAPVPLGTVLYVMTSERLRADRAAHVRSYRFPTLDLGLGRLAEMSEDIPREIRLLLGEEERVDYHQKAQMLRSNNPLTLIVEDVVSQVKTGCF